MVKQETNDIVVVCNRLKMVKKSGQLTPTGQISWDVRTVPVQVISWEIGKARKKKRPSKNTLIPRFNGLKGGSMSDCPLVPIIGIYGMNTQVTANIYNYVT